MELAKSNGLQMMLPEMMQGAMPIQVPELSFETDPISKAFHNLALRQLAKSEALKAEIAGSRNTQTRHYLETMERMLTFGVRVEEVKQLIKDAQALRRAEIQKAQAEATQAYYDAKSAEMEFEVRVINLKKMKMEAGDGPA